MVDKLAEEHTAEHRLCDWESVHQSRPLPNDVYRHPSHLEDGPCEDGDQPFFSFMSGATPTRHRYLTYTPYMEVDGLHLPLGLDLPF